MLLTDPKLWKGFRHKRWAYKTAITRNKVVIKVTFTFLFWVWNSPQCWFHSIHISQKSPYQRESGHSTLAECVVWSCWPWSVLRGVLVFNIPLVCNIPLMLCPWPYWGHSSPLLQRGRLKLTYSLTAADLLFLRYSLPLLPLCAAKHRPSQCQVITFSLRFRFSFRFMLKRPVVLSMNSMARCWKRLRWYIRPCL